MTTLDYATVSRYWKHGDFIDLGPVHDGWIRFPGRRGPLPIPYRMQDRQSPDSRGKSRWLCARPGQWEWFLGGVLRPAILASGRRRGKHDRCMRHWKNDVRPTSNVTLVHGDVMLFQPEDQYDRGFSRWHADVPQRRGRHLLVAKN